MCTQDEISSSVAIIPSQYFFFRFFYMASYAKACHIIIRGQDNTTGLHILGRYGGTTLPLYQSLLSC